MQLFRVHTGQLPNLKHLAKMLEKDNRPTMHTMEKHSVTGRIACTARAILPKNLFNLRESYDKLHSYTTTVNHTILTVRPRVVIFQHNLLQFTAMLPLFYTSVFQPFCCSGTLHKCDNHSRNPMQ